MSVEVHLGTEGETGWEEQPAVAAWEEQEGGRGPVPESKLIVTN